MRIIIVEDENSIRNGLKNMLPKLDSSYQVIGTAADGAQGLSLVREHKPDLVIMDIQMPEMDGLTMLEKIRQDGIGCRVVVLTAYSDFSYAKRAIELNIDNYLLKPIKIAELRDTLKIISQSLETEQEQEREDTEANRLSLSQMLRGSILAEIPMDEHLRQVARSKYDLDVNEVLAVTTIRLDEGYEDKQEEVVKILNLYLSNSKSYRCCIFASERFRMICTVFYHMENPENLCGWYDDVIVPAVKKILTVEAVFYWRLCHGLEGLPRAFETMDEENGWNLTFFESRLIISEEIASWKVAGLVRQLKYPIELEGTIKQAAGSGNRQDYEKGLIQLRTVCTEGIYSPEEIREACLRICLAILNLANSVGKITGNTSAGVFVGELSQAVTWQRICGVMWNLFEEIEGKGEKDQEDTGLSTLVRKATRYLEEYYDQGITLEELADRLGVSEEHLSTQFKKETGRTFSETIRGLRIDRIKGLLLNSNLKLNQIADMVGYSDPKYMSKVFKEEVGMLPAEFRKEHL